MPIDRDGLAGLTVLVAEDEPAVALELEATLREAGGAVLGPVAAAADGLALLAAGAKPDAALANARLGDGPAAALVEALRAAGVPVGLCTGYGAGDLEPALRGLPVLAKPHHPLAVVAFVRGLAGAS